MTYKQKLQTVIDWREQIKQAIPDIKYKRVYTRRTKDNQCETTFWGLSRDSWNKISKFVVSDNFKHNGCCLGKSRRIINTKVGMRYLGKLSTTLSTIN